MSEWARVEISEVCELIVDCVNKTAPVVDFKTPYKMLRTTNVRHGRVDTSGCKFVVKETFEKWTRRAELKFGDVLLTREAPIGEVGMIMSDDKLFLGQRLMQYRADPQKINPHFLLYSFLSRDLKHQFGMHEGTGSVVSHIRVGDCFKFKINVPPLPEQNAIAHILRTLDAKIELNRKMNQTLEAMAQALFKSWFMDFDPVMDNALAAGNPIPDELQAMAEKRSLVPNTKKLLTKNSELAAKFPFSFVFNVRLGKWIPDGWEVKRAEEISKISIGKTPPRKEQHWFETTKSDSNYTWVSIKNMGNSGMYISDSDEYLTDESVSKFNVNKVPSDTVILSFKMTVGRVAITTKELCTNEAIAHFVNPKHSLFSGYIYQYLKIFDYDGLGSTSSIATAINSKLIKHIPFLVPSAPILSEFKKSITNIHKRILETQNQTETLTQLRDRLLPELISGRVRVPKGMNKKFENND